MKKMILKLLVTFTLVSCAASPTQTEVSTTKKLTMNPSFYEIAVESKDDTGEMVNVLSPEGKPLVMVHQSFFKKLAMEGTGRLLDGRLLNYNTKLYGSSRFNFVDYPTGARLNKITAFKSVAVDPKFLQLGSKLFIPSTKGIKLPDGSIHDGFWSADDIGSAIKGNRIDLFCGEYGWSILEKQGVIHGKDLEVHVLDKQP